MSGTGTDNAINMMSSWQWMDSSRPEDAGDGWAAEGNPMYKWAQYDKPPVPIGGEKIAVGDTVLDARMFEEEERTPFEHSDRIILLNLPFLGRVQFVNSLQGFIQSSIVVLYWIYGSWSIFTVILFPRYSLEQMTILPLMWYGIVSILCIVAFVRAVTTNPGRIPVRAKKERPLAVEQLEDPNDSQYCVRCAQQRPRLAHHCSACGQCVRKMDHHCPWVNNCVGEENRFLFTQLVLYAMLMSSTALLLILIDSYYLPPMNVSDESQSFVSHHRYDLKIVCLVLSSLMTMMGGGLFFTQVCLMRYEMSTLDFYKIQQMMQRGGQNPYVNGIPWPEKKRSCREVFNEYCGTKRLACYFIPCRRRVAPIIDKLKGTHIV